MRLQSKPAFTLAEVLITLGIIGVVAAMTIPNLITEHQKRTAVTKLQRAISVLNQAYRLAYDDVGEASAEEAFNMGSEEYFNTYWAPYIKVLTYCSSYDVCGYDSNTPFILIDGSNDSIRVEWDGYRTTFLTMDGFLYQIWTGQGSGKKDSEGNEGTVKSNWVTVDINGGAGPNRYGRDVFFLKRVEGSDIVEGGAGIQPYGYDATDKTIKSYCSSSASGDNRRGYYCLEKIRRAGWKIEKDYPWN